MTFSDYSHILYTCKGILELTAMTKGTEKQLKNRLHRIAGQIGGIEKMLEGGVEAQKVVMQMDAVKAGIDSLKRSYVREYVRSTLSTELDSILQIL